MEKNIVPPLNLRPLPPHQLLAIGGQIVHAAGEWGDGVPVAEESVRVTAVRRDAKFAYPPTILDSALTNRTGDFMLMIPIPFIRLPGSRVFLEACERATNKRSFYNLAQLANLRLATQTQLIGPLVVHWGPGK